LARSTTMRTDLRQSAEPSAGGKPSPDVDAMKSRRELYEEARNAGIVGRSAMNKEQLIEALRRRRAMRESRAPAPTEAPMRPHRSGGKPATVPRPPARPDRCAIVYEESGRYGEFHVVVPETNGSRRSVSRSPAFRAPSLGRLRRRGAARVAHELLVMRLEASGWLPVDAGGPWHALAFVRLPGEGMRRRRSLVTVVRDAGEARFVAEELDTFGNPTPLVVSAPFGARRFGRLRASPRAKTALTQLVKRMDAEGWRPAPGVGKAWYEISLGRSVAAAR
jgi:hypothetical protein